MTVLQHVEQGGRTYLLVDNGSSVPWATAETDAVSRGGHLVTIDNQAEQDFVYATFKDVGFELTTLGTARAVWFWLGLNDEETEGSFEWSSGAAVTYTNWFDGQPASDLANQDYAAYFFFSSFDAGGQWFAIPDDDPNNYTYSLIEIDGLLATQGNDLIDGGIGKDVISGAGGNDTLTGFAGNDTLSGGAGNDVLVGGLGTDVMTGGQGDDTYDLDDTFGDDADRVIELANGGTDTVVISDSFFYTMPDHIENLVSQVTEDASRFSGNAVKNQMQGSRFGDYFEGLGGNDRLRGNAGDDRLDGGDGNDVLTGGDGDDSLAGGLGRDTLTGGRGVDSYVTFGETDRIIFNSVAEIGKGRTSLTRESIGRFDNGEHLVDFSAIDANGSAAGDAAFTFIKQRAFSGNGAEIRFEVVDVAGTTGDYLLLQGDVNGDRRADFQIQFGTILSGIDFFRLTADHFIL